MERDLISFVMNQLNVVQYYDEARMLSHCAPLFFLPNRNSGPEGIANSGTVGLIALNGSHFLVTCAHVFDGFCEYRKKNHNAVLATVFRNGPGLPVIIEPDTLIDCGGGLLDIAVFNAFPTRWDMEFKEFVQIQKCPIAKVVQGDLVSFVGFAANHRRLVPEACFFDYAMFGHAVGLTAEHQFILTSRGETQTNDGQVVPRINMGGMSGCPVFRRKQKRFEFCGILSMEGPMGIAITHASFLLPDGRLNRDSKQTSV